jgi:hypothetical protein
MKWKMVDDWTRTSPNILHVSVIDIVDDEDESINSRCGEIRELAAG